mmetsp:Transcript_4617/g.13957  ORF Transcript_4617/g.13957 Transcript_4617/m.13957 type:complete len:212 (-) Transcript_4617:914-1549(-)
MSAVYQNIRRSRLRTDASYDERGNGVQEAPEYLGQALTVWRVCVGAKDSVAKHVDKSCHRCGVFKLLCRHARLRHRSVKEWTASQRCCALRFVPTLVCGPARELFHELCQLHCSFGRDGGFLQRRGPISNAPAADGGAERITRIEESERKGYVMVCGLPVFVPCVFQRTRRSGADRNTYSIREILRWPRAVGFHERIVVYGRHVVLQRHSR